MTRWPLKRAALELGRSEDTARRLARAGRLEAWRDASGRWWTTAEAVQRFLAPGCPVASCTEDAAAVMRRALEGAGR